MSSDDHEKRDEHTVEVVADDVDDLSEYGRRDDRAEEEETLLERGESGRSGVFLNEEDFRERDERECH